MHVRTTAFASMVAIGLAAGMTTAAASEKAAADAGAAKQKQEESAPAAAPQRFATLKSVKAEPMNEAEMKEVKGLHIHFWTGGAPVGEPHIVNHLQNNLGNGQAPAGSGPGYSGLCVANVHSPSIFINPGGGC